MARAGIRYCDRIESQTSRDHSAARELSHASRLIAAGLMGACGGGSGSPSTTGGAGGAQGGATTDGGATNDSAGTPSASGGDRDVPSSGGEATAGTSTAGDGNASSSSCEPGTQRLCYEGPDGTEDIGPCRAGHMTCNDDGSEFGPCEGQIVPSEEDCFSIADEDCDGASGLAPGSRDIDCVCDPNAAPLPCYDGPPQSHGVGDCRDGESTCSEDGKVLGCNGQVKPLAEDCASAVADADCDGLPSESDPTCTCIDGVFDDCRTEDDEDCSGSSPVCSGAPLTGKSLGGQKDDLAFAAAYDGQGNRVLVGASDGTSNGYAISGSSIWISKVDPDGKVLFDKRTSAGNTVGAYGVARALAIDPWNNEIFVTGEYKGSINFGLNGGFKRQLTSSNGSTDMFVVHMKADGDVIDSQSFGSSGVQIAYGLALQKGSSLDQDVLCVVGQMDGSANLGIKQLTAQGQDAFVLGLGRDLFVKWGERYGDAEAQAAWGVAAMPDNHFAVVGEFASSIDFGGAALTTPAPAGNVDAFVVELDGNDGALIWQGSYGDGGDQRAYAVSSSPTQSGDLAVVGAFSGSIGFGKSTLKNGDATGVTVDAFVAYLKPKTDTYVWAKRYGDAKYSQVPTSVNIDASGSVLLTGFFQGALDFGGSALVNADPSNVTRDVFLAKLAETDGSHVWSVSAGDAADQRAFSVSSSASGRHALMAGGLSGNMTLGAPVGTLTSSGGYDAFTLELDQ